MDQTSSSNDTGSQPQSPNNSTQPQSSNNSIQPQSLNSGTEPQTREIPISFLARMITPFEGNPEELTHFLQNAENALNLASQDQVIPLTALIFSKVSSDVKNKINISEVRTFTELERKLKQIFQITESLTFLQEQLETCRQKPNESIKEFYLRIEKLSGKISRITRETAGASINRMLLYGKQELIAENALRRFTHHCKPEISNVLRHGKFNSINAALSVACEEEAFLSIQTQTKNLNINPSTNKKQCKICKRTNHDTNQCRFKNSSNQQNYNQSSPPQNNVKTCNYCHLRGHTIDECRRRKNNQNFYPNPKVAHISHESEFQDSLNYQSLGLTEAPVASTSTESASQIFMD